MRKQPWRRKQPRLSSVLCSAACVPIPPPKGEDGMSAIQPQAAHAVQAFALHLRIAVFARNVALIHRLVPRRKVHAVLFRWQRMA